MTNPIREALTELRSEREDVERTVSSLSVSLSNAQTRLGYLDGAIENLQQLLPVDEAEEAESADDADTEAAGVAEEVVSNARAEYPTPPPVVRRKYPSTTMVTDLINELDRPVHREEIVELFHQRYGIPSSWNNPRNTLGNALLRAWEGGLILRVDQNQFAPRGFEGVTAREVREGRRVSE